MGEPIDSNARCVNCHHPYAEHTGRSIGYEDQKVVPGDACEHQIDFRHTCDCPGWGDK